MDCRASLRETLRADFLPARMNTTEIFLVAMIVIFALPYLVWRLGRTDYWAPLVVVQIVTGIALGPGALGAAFPEYYAFVFNPAVIQALNGVAWWAVMLFVWIAGIELDLAAAWREKREAGTTALLAMAVPMALGCGAALLLPGSGWIGAVGAPWQFVLGIGMSCAVTALPILVLLMEKMAILRTALGQRILRYASLDDIAIWSVLALVLAEWQRIGRQALFLAVFAAAAWAMRQLMQRVAERDRWYLAIVWLPAVSLGADWCGLHFMIGAFLAGAVLDAHWFDQRRMDLLRDNVLLVLMPVFFLSTGLRTQWGVGGAMVFVAAALLLVAAVAGKLAGVALAGRLLGWSRTEALAVGLLLQTKALIMIIFANVLLDKQIISADTFTALLIMAVASTMITVPAVTPLLKKMGLPQHPGAAPPSPYTRTTAGDTPATRTAGSEPPQRQPVSIESRSARSIRPSVDQWPKAIGVPAVWRLLASNRGTSPGGAAPAPSFTLKSSVLSLASTKRMRVSTLMTKRQRSAPSSASSQRAGWLPYMCGRKPARSGPRSIASTSAASARAWNAVHAGATPACTHSQPWRSSASGRARSHSSQASRSAEARISSSVSLACVGRTPCATASRCRSWLPSSASADAPSARMRCSTCSDCGPRLTRSPSTVRLSREGEKPTLASRRSKASQQPCTSPIR